MILKEDIAVFSCGRLTSQRCKNKMVRDFGDTSLVDVFLSKLQGVGGNTFFAGYDNIFKEKCEDYNIDFIQRTEASSNSEVAKEIYNFLHDVDYKYLLMVNACIPFLKLETIKNFTSKCDDLKKPAFAVFNKNNYFMSSKEEPYNFNKEIKTINTKYVEPVKEFAHIFYFFEREHFLKNDWYWNWNEVNYIDVPHGIESLDIDTEEDFEMARLLWENKEVRERYIDY
jgi:CMP-N-acetylneuraminic acid synthetase